MSNAQPSSQTTTTPLPAPRPAGVSSEPRTFSERAFSDGTTGALVAEFPRGRASMAIYARTGAHPGCRIVARSETGEVRDVRDWRGPELPRLRDAIDKLIADGFADTSQAAPASPPTELVIDAQSFTVLERHVIDKFPNRAGKIRRTEIALLKRDRIAVALLTFDGDGDIVTRRFPLDLKVLVPLIRALNTVRASLGRHLIAAGADQPEGDDHGRR